MARLALLVLFSSTLLLAQSNDSATTNKQNSNSSNGTVTVRGCVDRERGDYVLTQQNPGATYELQGTSKAKLRNYLGQRVEVTGTQSPSLSTSSDTTGFSGSPAPTTIRVTSIKTLAKECSERPVP